MVCKTVWEQEAALWEYTQGLTFTNLNGLPASKRIEQLKQHYHCYLINYELAKWLYEIGGFNRFRGIVMDESTYLKSHQAQCYKAIKTSTRKYKLRIAMTGTPRGNSYIGLWSQIDIIADVNPLGRNITTFRYQFCKPHPNVEHQWIFRPEMAQDLMRRIKPYVFAVEPTRTGEDFIRYSKISLPELPPRAAYVHQQLLEEMAVRIEGDLVTYQQAKVNPDESYFARWLLAANKPVALNKLRQIESGQVYANDGESLVTYHDYKIQALKVLIESLQGSPLLLFYEFKHEIDRIKKVFPQVSGLDVKAWNHGQIPLMALHFRAAGHGLNLQKGGHKILFFTTPWSWEYFSQCCGRLNRDGQQDVTTIYYFAMPDGVEEKVIKGLTLHRRKELDLFKEMVS